ncbi:hypothetical protein T09_10086 [Trichinella sp. T9]|nr:hypothetical protein T09_10086 [Trichinella sp. T9]
MEQRKCENADDMKQNKRRQERLKFIFTKKFQCTKTGFQRCTMQISIAINDALSSVRVHLYKEWNKENVKTRTTRSRTREDKRDEVRIHLYKIVYFT